MDTKFKAPPAKLKELAPGVYAFLQPGGAWISNSGLIIGKNYATVIDSQTNKYEIENFINLANKVNNKPVRLLCNTHYHMDHTFTNYYFKDAIAFTTDRTLKETKRVYPSNVIGLRKILGEPNMSYDGAKIVPQDMTFEGKLTVYDGIHEIQFIDLGPAHSPSDIIVYLPKEKVVFTGDLIHEHLFDKSNTAVAPGLTSVMDGSYKYIEVLEYLTAMDAEQYVPGHGGSIVTREAIAQQAGEMIEFLLLVREEARKLYNKGMTYKEATKNYNFEKFKNYGDKNALWGMMYGNFARAWSEFNGAPLGIALDQEEMRAQSLPPNPDGTRMERIDLGYNRPEPWE